jgi:hypothetical protein
VHSGSTAVEQHGEGLRGQGSPQVKDSCQDLVGEGEPGRTAPLYVAVPTSQLSRAKH